MELNLMGIDYTPTKCLVIDCKQDSAGNQSGCLHAMTSNSRRRGRLKHKQFLLSLG